MAHISSPIEVDFYLKHIAEAFDVSRDAMYETFSQKKRQVQNKKKEEIPKNFEKFSPNIFLMLSAFIEKFSLLEIFLQKCAYAPDDIKKLPNS